MRDDFTKFSTICQWFQMLIHPALIQRQISVTSLRLDNLRLQAPDSLGKLDPTNQVAITALKEMIGSSQKDSIRRKVSYT
ncbi:hypothetical protein RintRC_7535 [Richelia intracellularis]|nr:hypothetical protein RintRC_7535 [Richelia intracellularis]